jgi:hypothetical protein
LAMNATSVRLTSLGAAPPWARSGDAAGARMAHVRRAVCPHAPVAQLDRASVYGHKTEQERTGRHNKNRLQFAAITVLSRASVPVRWRASCLHSVRTRMSVGSSGTETRPSVRVCSVRTIRTRGRFAQRERPTSVCLVHQVDVRLQREGRRVMTEEPLHGDDGPTVRKESRCDVVPERMHASPANSCLTGPPARIGNRCLKSAVQRLAGEARRPARSSSSTSIRRDHERARGCVRLAMSGDGSTTRFLTRSTTTHDNRPPCSERDSGDLQGVRELHDTVRHAPLGL